MGSQPAVDQSLYVAVLLFESQCDSPGYLSLYQESFVLITAQSLEVAQKKATHFGLQQQPTYQNERGDTIVWSFKQVVDVNPALSDRLEEVTELYARHFRNYEAYCKFEALMGDPEAQL